MTFFKSASLRFIVAFVSIVGLASCKKDVASEAAPATFYFDNVKTAQVLPTEFNSWGYPKRLQYKLLACPKDIALMAPIIGQSFEIRDDGGGSKTMSTDSRGCLQWDEFYTYDHFAPETFINVKRTIIGRGGHTGVVEISLAVNPWEKSALDLRYESPQQLEQPKQPLAFSSQIVDGQPSAATIDLKNMALQYLAIDYGKWKVSPQLKLTVVHNYRLRFEPRVVRKALQVPTKTETPERGKVAVTIAIVRESRDTVIAPEQYVTHHTGVYDLQVGGVIEDIDLQFEDTLAEVASRMRAFVKIVPLVDSPSLAPVRLTSPIGPLPGQSSMQLVPSEIDADVIVAQVERKKASSSIANLKAVELFEQVSGFKKLTPEEWDGKAVPKNAQVNFQQAQTMFAGGLSKSAAKALHRRLCHEVYAELDDESKENDGNETKASQQESSSEAKRSRRFFRWRKAETPDDRLADAIERCVKDPEEMMNLEVRELVDSLKTPVVRRTGQVQSESLTIQSSFSISESETKSDGMSKRWTKFGYNVDGALGASLGGDFGLSAKIGAGARMGSSQDWYWSHARSVDERTTNSVTASMTRTVVVEAYALDIDVVARKCLIAAPAEELDGVVTRGVFFCDDRVADRTAREAYYFINQTGSGSSPFVDGLSTAEMPWRMFMRGGHVYSNFKRIVSDANLELVMEPMEKDQKDSKISEKAKEAFMMSPMTQDFPGMLSPSLSKRAQ